MGKWAATRMESLVWEEKLVRIKVLLLDPSDGLDSVAKSTLIHTLYFPLSEGQGYIVSESVSILELCAERRRQLTVNQ